MKKIFSWVWDNILFLLTLFLLVFIPLYPKIPLLDVKNTWVYVRAEDFVVVLALLVWVILLFSKKITLRTPLTLPVIIFWIIGSVATIHGVLLIFPSIANVFPNVAFLSMLRRVEYMSLFFIAFAGMRDKRFIAYVVFVLILTLLLVVGYGVGQKYFGFPAYLTMNEEFAKGIPIRLSELSRVPSTFGGHYDLAAYLVLVIPILTSMIFGFRSWMIRLLLGISVCLGFVLLFMTVSRVSFFVLLISLFIVFLFHTKKLIFFSLPLIIILAFLFLSFSTNLLERFGNSIKQVDVLVDAKTGEAIGHVKVVPSKNFENKTIRERFIKGKSDLDISLTGRREDLMEASPSAVLPFWAFPPEVFLLTAPNAPTGEELPQGTGYINLTLSPVTKKVERFFYEQSLSDPGASESAVLVYYGNFLIKRASAYDLSFTTRFQGEWPKAIEAFKKNVLFGSGYSSISLAVDNNYLRILGEIGLLGFASFFAIFLFCGIYIRKVLPSVDSPKVRSFVLGFVAGVVGLALNAIFIDVFEASKVAYVLWILTGVSLGILSLYQTKNINLFKEFKNVVTSSYAIILYLFIVTVIVFSPMIGNSFVGDDFTWFRWAADCNNGCPTIFSYFTDSNGFFYRPGTKTYFLSMYSVFWLNQAVYHFVSIFLHFIAATLFFLLAKKILKDFKLSVLASFLFLILSGYSEAVFWISSTGFLFNAVFALSSLLFFITWEEKKKKIYFIASLSSVVLGLLFHELGVVTPFLIVLYKFANHESFSLSIVFKKQNFLPMFIPIFFYLVVRYFANSHWFSGDYSYNLLKLPFNVIGNTIGYLTLDIFGPAAFPIYNALRNFSRENSLLALATTIGMFFVLVLGYRLVKKRIEREDRRIIIFGFFFFFITSLPFLGLGNITSRYSYLASMGLILLFVFFIKKLYHYLFNNGVEIALASVSFVITLFSLLHFIQIQQIHSDWYEAGEKAKRFFVAIDESYVDYWGKEPMEFYFVNVPIRHGEAWVFPVGLSDALWFSYRNPSMRVDQSQSVEQALNFVDMPRNEKVFVFDERGRVIEKKRVLKIQ